MVMQSLINVPFLAQGRIDLLDMSWTVKKISENINPKS